MKEGTYLTIQWWMVDGLSLKGNELLIYAIIYGFCQDGEGEYNGSLSYLSEWTHSTKMGVMKALKRLLEKEYIIKTEKNINGIKYCKYTINKKFNGMQQSLPGVCNKVAWGMQQSLPNNIEDIYITNNINYDVKKQKKFIKPTIEEIKKYCSERKNNVDAETFFDFYESKGWVVGKSSMKDWKAAIRTWERSNHNAPSKPKDVSPYYKPSEEQLKKEQEYIRACEAAAGYNVEEIEGLEDW